MRTGSGSASGVGRAGRAAGAVRIAPIPAGDLAVDHVVRGMVRSVALDGGVLLELNGRLLQATTDLQLVTGMSYDFVVAARTPQIVLKPLQPLDLPSQERAARDGWLGPGVRELGPLLRGSEVAERFGSGQLTARELAAFHREPGSAALLRVLGELAGENASRAAHGGAQVLPLPVGEGKSFRDARMFVRFGQEGGTEPRADSGSFTIVLLTELSKLGPLRIDIDLARQVTVTMHVARAEAEPALRMALDSLRHQLEDSGLAVGRISLRMAASGLPVSDLLTPPRFSDPAARVDVHA